MYKQSPNRVFAGRPEYEIPFTHVDYEFWPDREALRQEAIAVRENDANRFRLPIPNSRGDDPVVLDFQYINDKTPMLAKFHQNFVDWFGDPGRVHIHYFYIDANANYEWHRDNVLNQIQYDPKHIAKQMGKDTAHLSDRKSNNFPINCALNLVLTEDDGECECAGYGTYKYKCGVLNTSHLHRVQPSSLRILARVSFLELIYEEVIHRIKKVEKRRKNDRLD